ncbi:hypothetical protein DFS33DRAFT_1408580 [Desarmillaria ectypa]|nr:hypothetical protein DFS33DRAFT_1408580 [Desarmillaria ectypa]
MPRTPSKKSKKNVQCQVCLKVYADATGLSRHSKTHLPDGESHKHKCPHCPMRMWQKANLDAHIRAKHTSERPFKCPAADCSYVSASSGCLHRHRIKCTKLHAPPQFIQQPLPPKQLLPAVDVGMPLEEIVTFLTPPQPDLKAWYPEELMSSTFSQSDLSSNLQNMLGPSPISPHTNHLHLTEMVASTSAKDNFFFIQPSANSNTDPFFFDSSLPAASPTLSYFSSSSSSTSLVKDERLSCPLTLDFHQPLTSGLSWNNLLSTFSSPLDIDVTESLSFPVSLFSSTSFKNERLSSSLSFDLSTEGFSPPPFEQFSIPLLFKAEPSPSLSSFTFDSSFSSSEQNLVALPFV